MQNRQLDKIKSSSDIKKLDYRQLLCLCEEIREMLINTVSENGGHLSSNLGTVELTVAIHKVFDCPNDQIVWDVGHQSYAHKILTGRAEKFKTLRQENGISGFPRPSESKYDAFIAGHAGISVSAALGLAIGKKLNNDMGYVISVTGDGAMSNGIIYEGINNAGRTNTNLIVILNDNEMSISKNVGALAKHLSIIRSSTEYFKAKDLVSKNLLKIPVVGEKIKNTISKTKSAIKQYIYHSNIFEDFGFTYLGPVDGHDLESLCDVLNRAKALRRPVLVHVETKKGNGYSYAQNDPTKYHGVSGFDKEKGIKTSKNSINFSSVFGTELTEFAKNDKKICAVTAAMSEGTGLGNFALKYRKENRFFDVGIAESHAVTFCAGLSTNGLTPVFAVYSTFLQRCYDQLVHDVSIEKRHIVLAVDRAGIVGDDGETHQGIFDVAMLKNIPNAKIYSPSNYKDLKNCLKSAIYQDDGLVAVRYPRGTEPIFDEKFQSTNVKYDLINENKSDIIIVTYGRLWNEAIKAYEKLKILDKNIAILKLTIIMPLDDKIVEELIDYKNVLFYEEGIKNGGIGESLGNILMEKGFSGKYVNVGIENFVPQSTIERALEKLKLDSNAMIEKILEII